MALKDMEKLDHAPTVKHDLFTETLLAKRNSAFKTGRRWRHLIEVYRLLGNESFDDGIKVLQTDTDTSSKYQVY